MLIIFINLDIKNYEEIMSIHEKFDKRLSEEINPEILALTWIPSDLFLKYLQNKKKNIYSKVKNFLVEDTKAFFFLADKLGLHYIKT